MKGIGWARIGRPRSNLRKDSGELAFDESMLRSHVREEIVRNSGDTSVAGVGQYIQEEKPAAVLAAITRLGQASAGARSELRSMR